MIAIIGAGAWGTALSIVAGRKGVHEVRLWAYEKEVCESVEARRLNELFLPGQPVPDAVLVTNNFEQALQDAEIVVSVMPSHHCRRLFVQMRPFLRKEMLFVSATKGIEDRTHLRMTEIISQILCPEFIPTIGALSGPTFAKEVAARRPDRDRHRIPVTPSLLTPYNKP